MFAGKERKEKKEKIKKIKGKRNRRLITQMGTLIFVMFSLALVVNTGTSFYRWLHLTVSFLSEVSENLGDYVTNAALEYNSLPWCLDFMEEHGEDVLVIQDADEDEIDAQLAVIMDPESVTVEEAENFSNMLQYTLVYMVYSGLITDTLHMQNIIPEIEISITRRTEDGDLFVFFQGDRDNRAEEFYQLDVEELAKDSLVRREYDHHGEVYLNADAHNYWYEGMKGDRPKETSEWTFNPTKDPERPFILSVYCPLVIDEKVVAVVTVERAWAAKDIVEMVTNAFKAQLNNAIYLIICGVVLLVFLYRLTIRPLASMQNSVQLYKTDKNKENIVENLGRIRSKNEIGRLSDDVAEMAVELDRYGTELVNVTAEKERIGAELTVAADIQMGMLPKIEPGVPAFEDRKDFSIFASMHPAKEVGGDLFDFLLIDDDHLAIVIGDVSGKGVPASLFMAITTSLIRYELQEKTHSVADIMGSVNNCLCEGNEQMMFVTIWIAVLEISTGKLVASSGGHEYPMFRFGDKDFEYFEEESGLPLGIIENGKYPETTYQMHPGDTLFVYTDGIAEAINTADEQFDLERMLDVLNEDPDASPEELETRMQQRLAEFVGEADQFDDMTILCVKYNGSGEADGKTGTGQQLAPAEQASEAGGDSI